MSQDVSKSTDDFLSIIKSIIKQEIDKKDITALCKVVSINKDNSVNVYVEPDETNIVNNIPNNTLIQLLPNDYIYVYKVNNQLSNSFVLNKIGQNNLNNIYSGDINDDVLKQFQTLLNNKQDKLVAGENITINNETNVISCSAVGITDYNDLTNIPVKNLGSPYNDPANSINRVLYLMNCNNLSTGLYRIEIFSGIFLINYKGDENYAVVYGSSGFSKYEKQDSVFVMVENLYDKLDEGNAMTDSDINSLF